MSDQKSFFHVRLLHRFSEPGAIFDPNGSYFPFPFPLIPVVLHSMCIMMFNNYYRQVALWLTEKENHRSQSQFESSLILKRFFFEAFDCYLPLFYLAFYELDAKLLKLELMALYTTDTFRRVLTETLVPLILLSTHRIGGVLRNRSLQKKIEVREGVTTEDERIAREMKKDEYEIFDDYLEMVIELGYITLFASAFPLAPLLSLICNIVEFRSDIFKVVFLARKPPCERRAHIGVWADVQVAMAWISILTNCLIFGFSSEQMVAWFPFLFEHNTFISESVVVLEAGNLHTEAAEIFKAGMGRYAVGFVFLLEHTIILFVLAIIFFIPSEPRWVTDRRLRKSYLSRTVLRKAIGTSSLSDSAREIEPASVLRNDQKGKGIKHRNVKASDVMEGKF
jgi:anoctamin-10